MADTIEYNYKAVSHKEMAGFCKTMAAEIKRRFGKPACIAFIIRGGIVPGRLLSDWLGCKELIGIRARKFQDIGKFGKVTIDQSSVEQIKALNLPDDATILLVDDISGTGETLKCVKDSIALAFPKARIVTAAALSMPGTKCAPDVFADTVSDDSWVVFEYEVAETMRSFEVQNNKKGLDWLKKAF